MKVRIVIVVLATSLALFCGACNDRKAAKKRVTDALNPPKISVHHDEAAALKLAHGFALIRLHTTATNFHYRVWYSETAMFSTTSRPTIDGYSMRVLPLEIGETKIWIGFGDESSTEVHLDFGDW